MSYKTRSVVIVGADSKDRTITVQLTERPSGVKIGDVAEITYYTYNLPTETDEKENNEA